MNEAERIGIEEGIFIESKEEAIRLIQEWTWDRIISWENDIRPGMIRILIDKVLPFGVPIPDFWYEVASNQPKYNAIHDDDYVDMEDEEPMDEEDIYAHRPTADSEREIVEAAS